MTMLSPKTTFALYLFYTPSFRRQSQLLCHLNINLVHAPTMATCVYALSQSGTEHCGLAILVTSSGSGWDENRMSNVRFRFYLKPKFGFPKSGFYDFVFFYIKEEQDFIV